MKAALRALLLILGTLVLGHARATHNQAGEILICHVGASPSVLLYEVTIVTWTNPNSQADRPDFILDWGDGFIDTIPRQSATIMPIAGIEAQRNLYVAQHLYGGVGTYILEYIDPNRVGNVINIHESISVPMSVRTQLRITPTGGNTCSPRFLNPPIQNACLGQPWIHNPGAYDSDGDSLSFSPQVCLGGDLNGDGHSDPIPGYRFPNEVSPGPNNNYSIDPVTGTITWDSPQQMGIYNIAFRVTEWRRTQSGGWVETGYVIRDMQVIVVPCTNTPPVIAQVRDTCVVAGSLLNLAVQASDSDAGQTITLSAFGAPFEITPNPATFNTSPAQGTAFGTFSWNVHCSHVRQQAYQAVFKAADNYNPVQLHDYATVNITVVAPAPQDPVATPSGSTMELQWSPSMCANATGYRIYRRQGMYGFVPDHCETDVPAYTGYQFVGSTVGHANSSWIDQGLAFGITYCYMVVATFPDGARSYASVEFCNMLERDVPVITKVSVVNTSTTAGSDSLEWGNAYALDTLQHPGPYHFRVYQGSGFNTANQLVHTSAEHPYLAHPDTQLVVGGLNTAGSAHAFRVELVGANGPIGSSNTASSVYLTAAPNDELVTLSFQHAVPWLNTAYDVFRHDGTTWQFLATATGTSWTDTGLVNGDEYCYLVKSRGAYNDPSIHAPLLNYSQEICATPVDLTAPCPPVLSLNNDCEIPLNILHWTNPAHACGDDDVAGYRIWFTDSLGGTPVPIATITNPSDTSFQHTDGMSVAGCYAVTAFDLVGNESAVGDTLCGDNCPIYTLPNIFTPNGDRSNDHFIPFPYRGVKEVDMQVFNRWGQVVFRTTDPDIGWNGTLLDSTEPVPDGVYFYACTVLFERLAGPEPVVLKGTVHILRTPTGPSE